MGTWYDKLLPLSQRQEINYALPYFMALKALELGEATDDNLAELAGHLKIAVYLPCEPHVIDEGRRAIRRLIRQWQGGLEYDASDVESVGTAIHEYHRIASNISKQRLQKAIKNVLKR